LKSYYQTLPSIPTRRSSDLQTRLSEHIEVLKILEPPMAARAATHASQEAIADMAEILQRQAEKVRRGEPGIEEDSEFHYAIALRSEEHTSELQSPDHLEYRI